MHGKPQFSRPTPDPRSLCSCAHRATFAWLVHLCSWLPYVLPHLVDVTRCKLFLDYPFVDLSMLLVRADLPARPTHDCCVR